ncbi:MAG: methylmalonyl-CoA epimerase [Sphingomonadales bacterium 32-68-7]|nr:MAG: methylmalonyl-CoA epimerase [Sphingomonadales bacterium 12-68-11]OYX09041.1 MAG: methylmalonyl-CoA epimerase [Sphingomonadales bacterium 32-68-7]
MKLGRLNHVGVATPDLDAAIAFWRETMGATVVTAPFDMPEQGVRVCFVDTPQHGTQIELLSPLSDESPIAAFLVRNPQGGQHHLAFEVPDIDEAHEWFTAQHKRILGPIRIGAHGTPVFFVHPKDMNGVLTEIMETPAHG